MKIRTGFVSNSSSSSFIIAVNGDADTCPTCGHKPSSIVDILERVCYDSGCDDSSIGTIEEYIQDYIQDEIDSCESTIAEMQTRDPNEKAYPQYGDTTVAQSIKWNQEDLEECKSRLAKFRQLQEEGKNLYHLQISYHDNLAKHILDENVAVGLVTIIEGDN